MFKKSLRSTTKATNTPIAQTPKSQTSISRKNANKIDKNTNQLPGVSSSASKRKHSPSPTSPDISHSAKKATNNMSITIDKLEKMFNDQAAKIGNSVQAQFVAHTEAVSKEIKTQLDNHAITVQNEIKKQLD